MAQFEKILTVSIKHLFFEEQVTDDISIRPDSATHTLFDRNGLLVRYRKGSLFVAAEVIKKEGFEGDRFLKHQLPQQSVFRFLIELKNPGLINTTRLPEDFSPSNILSLSNSNGLQHDGDLLLHPSGGAHDAKVVPLQTVSDVSFNVSAGKEKSSAELKLMNGRIIQKRKTNRNEDGEHLFGFQMAGANPGHYEVWFDSEKIHHFYWPGDRDREKIHGVIEIDCTESVSVPFRLFEEIQVPLDSSGEETLIKLNSPQFLISFSNMETVWRYHVSARQQNGLTGSSIQSDSYQFTETGAENGQKKTFESDGSLPLRENGVKGIRLKKTENGSERVLIEHLPGANGRLLEQDKNEKEKYYSDIYVYI